MSRQTQHRAAWVLALVLAAGLLFLNALIYSPWHRHDRLEQQNCSLCQFGHLSSPEPSSHIQLPPPALDRWLHTEEQPLLAWCAALCREWGRAPPA
jgi:hypothetical protein